MTAIATTTERALPAPHRRWFAQLGIDTAYVLVGFPLAVVAFTLVVTGLTAGVGLLPLFLVGIPILVGTAYLSRGLAEVERARLAPVLRRPRVPVTYRGAAAGTSWWARLFAPFTEGQYWLDALHALVRFPVSVATFTVVVTWWSMALAGLTYGLWDRVWQRHADQPQGPLVVDNQGLPELLGLADSTTNRILIYLAVGVVFTITLPGVVRLCALVEAWLAHGVLNGTATLRSQVAGLTVERATAQARTQAAASAEATALRRLERDLHDGPQQRLVRLAVDLGRARAQLESDPAAARQTVEEAIAQTREALDELRTLSRGIAPPILTDRGLAAATAALAARCTVPVSVDIPEDLPRLPALIEQTAYFTIAEALANIAKHSGASQAAVTVRVAGDQVSISVTDDGGGGAHLAKGHGLAGLADRLRAAGGSLQVASPAGGPTTVRAQLPSTVEPDGDGPA
jgi:signal transduction histidine kinase